MTIAPKNITISVTGAGGQISYAFLFRLISGDVFGPSTTINLILVEIPQAVERLTGLVFELQDCASPCLGDIACTADLTRAFTNTDFIILLGAFPRGPGMDRSQLLSKNAGIFKAQGAAINKFSPTAKIIVIGNPCCTNTHVAHKHAPDVPPENWFALTQLDVNRAKSLYAAASNGAFKVNDIKDEDVIIWGNHSNTMVVDYRMENNAIDLSDVKARVQTRGSEIIKARGASSAASAANAILDMLKNLITPNKFFSAGVISDGSYDVDPGLVFSFPIRTSADGSRHEIVKSLDVSSIQAELDKTQAELKNELEVVNALIADSKL